MVNSDSAVEIDRKNDHSIRIKNRIRKRKSAAAAVETEELSDSEISATTATGEESESEKTITNRREKLITSSWRFTNFTITSIIGLILLSQEYEWMLNPELYYKGYGSQPMSPLLKLFYKICYGSYAFGTWSVFVEPRQKDFVVMVVHHFTTLFLIHSSFMSGMYRIGAVILLLHEVSDPFMEIAKFFFYLNYKKAADVFFALFAVVFMVTRNFIFPYYVIASIPKYCHYEDGRAIPNGNNWIRDSAFIGLCLLEVLHIYWAGLILKMIKLALSNSGVQGDIRNEDD